MEVGGGYRAREGFNRFSAIEVRMRLGRLALRSRRKRHRSTFSLLVAL